MKTCAGNRLRLAMSALLLTLPAAGADARPLRGEERREVFERVFRLVRDRYYDASFNGRNWQEVGQRYRPQAAQAQSDDELYTILKRMVWELGDAHSAFWSPAERERAVRRVAAATGLVIASVDGAPTVVRVVPDSDASRSGVTPGFVLATVDGRPVGERLSEIQEELGPSSSERAVTLLSYHRLLEGEPGSVVRIGFERPDGPRLEVALARRLLPPPPPVTTRILPSGLAHLRIATFQRQTASRFRAALEDVRDAPGLILDVRGNPGGDLRGVLEIASGFFPARVSFGRTVSRSGRPPSLLRRLVGASDRLETGGKGAQAYAGVIAILIDEASGSGAELFTAGLQENGRAVVVGRRSCGCVLGAVGHGVKGGGRIDVSELDIVTAKGRRLEGNGVVPDVSVPLTLSNLRLRHDAALERAESLLRSKR